MRSLLLIAAVVTALSVAGPVPASAALHRDPIPHSVDRVELRSHNSGSHHTLQSGVVRGQAAHELVHDVDRLRPYPPGAIFSCPAPAPSASGKPNPPLIRTSRYRANGHTWLVSIGWCGHVVMVTEDDDSRSFHPSHAYIADLRRDFASLPSRREHVPTSLRKARLTYRSEPYKPVSRRRTVTHLKAKELVTAFDQLKRQPKNYVTCDVAGGPTEAVRFHTAAHTWIATQSACSEVQVTRDGKTLPTLLPSKRWARLVHQDLGR
jgi:hypothetical protein